MTKAFSRFSVSCAALLVVSSPFLSVTSWAQNKPMATIEAVKASIKAKKEDTPPGFADLVDKLLPAVVNISASKIIHPADDENSDGPDASSPNGPQTPPSKKKTPLDKFLHDYMKHKEGAGAPKREVQALGSGFIIDPSGIVVTNNHVIDNADQVSVTLHDGTELPAKIIGRDSQVDLAVLQVQSAHPLPHVILGHSDEARIGDMVLAIGNPFGLSGTVTSGIISSRKRNVAHGLYDDFIQTDAAINRGNSGGPLFNLKGEVIGINTLIYGGAGGDSIGIGFAIPADDARGIIEQLRRKGYVQRGWLGVSFQDLTRSMADDLDIYDENGTPAKGAILADVKKGGPSAKAGLKVGDVLLSVNGHEITGSILPRLVAEHQPGEKVTFDVWHKGKRKTVSLILEKSPKEADPLPSDVFLPKNRHQTIKSLGLKVSAIDSDLRTQYSLSDSQRGILVSEVSKNSIADQRGIKEGNIITQVGQTDVNSPDAFERAIKRVEELKKKDVLLLLQDKDGMKWVPLPLRR
ncbi:Do family serine endopeptidase [Aristophania vespae]|uniref:Probable periplasmic serine endoprotease DegP-like n=1 Tax=Aristophania vespae TaxID=2697033 RepID=A0A6P1NES5_9PROT|nr:Do family serine endopeptidase [Aristophania vespae]QHI95948.1 Do family serine endopeptidase [Aristophania vespae]UMM63692.1 Periplasmic pH-dependent serine endoprotease DegQ [Aristophania vespae]